MQVVSHDMQVRTCSLLLTAATRVSTVGQYIFEQADHSVHWLGSSQACV